MSGTDLVLKVSGMGCPACSGKVEAALKAVTGVRDVAVDLDRGQVRVTTKQVGVDPGVLIQAVRKIGYQAEMAAG